MDRADAIRLLRALAAAGMNTRVPKANACQGLGEAKHDLDWHVRFGSKADIARDQLNVRFTPESGHR